MISPEQETHACGQWFIQRGVSLAKNDYVSCERLLKKGASFVSSIALKKKGRKGLEMGAIGDTVATQSNL